jgi:hypothetical protein
MCVWMVTEGVRASMSSAAVWHSAVVVIGPADNGLVSHVPLAMYLK